MTISIEPEEAHNNQLDLVDLVKNLQRQMDEMQHMCEEDLRVLHSKNNVMHQGQGLKVLKSSTPTFQHRPSNFESRPKKNWFEWFKKAVEQAKEGLCPWPWYTQSDSPM